MPGDTPVRISVVTPSFNQAAFVERTIRSVLDQGYENLEYMVIDGGSTDGSVEIIEKYADQLTYWISERDSGQVEAINKGFKRATGDVVCWINSDDILMPGCLAKVAEVFTSSSVEWLVGQCVVIDEMDTQQKQFERLFQDNPDSWFEIARRFVLPQPSSFWRRNIFDSLGYLREDMHYAFDYEFWMRILFADYRPLLLEDVLAGFRVHDASKSCSQPIGFYKENLMVWKMFAPRLALHSQAKLHSVIRKESNDILCIELAAFLNGGWKSIRGWRHMAFIYIRTPLFLKETAKMLIQKIMKCKSCKRNRKVTCLQKGIWVFMHPFQTIRESGRIRVFCAKSPLLSSIYYALISDQFRREHYAVINGTIGYRQGRDDAVLSVLRRNLHRLEKGITAVPRSAVFAESFISTTLDCYSTLLQTTDNRDTINWGWLVLDQYFRVVSETDKIRAARDHYQQLKQHMRAPAVEPDCEPLEIGPIPDYVQFLALCRHRQAVRYYKDLSVPRELLEQACLAASESPSACNRQAFELFVFDTKEKLKEVQDLSIGTSTFAYNMQCLVFVVGNLGAYVDERDRHLIYIDSSLFAMSFSLALETLGLSTCFINWPDVEELERPLARILQIPPYKRCVMCLSIGYAANEVSPLSEKKAVQNLLVFAGREKQ